MKTWTELTWEEIHNLPIEEFDKLAKQQSTVFPDLLKITDEKEIIKSFYRSYKRKQM
jgi:hypothetical protein